jgi:hypothetical protein
MAGYNGCVFASLLEGVVEKEKLQSVPKNKFGLTINRRKETEYAKFCNIGEV